MSRSGAAFALALGLLGAVPAAAARPRGVVLVVVDALRRDRLGCYGYARPTSPNIDRLAARSVVFETAVAPANWTLPSAVSLFTSMPADEHGVGSPDRLLGPEPAVLAEVLARRGWRTGLFVGNRFLGPDYGLARGFDTVELSESAEFEDTAGAAARWLEGLGGRPFLLVVHAMDPHAPYGARPPAKHRFDPGYRGIVDRLRLDSFFIDVFNGERPLASTGLPAEYGALVSAVKTDARARAHLGAHYDDEVAVVDGHVGALLSKLGSLGLTERSLVILTADHGEDLGEGGRLGHGTSHTDAVLRVPLLLALPGRGKGRLEGPVSLIDLAPTILEAVGVPAPSSFRGRSLLPRLDGAPSGDAEAFSLSDLAGRRGGARTLYSGDWKLTVSGEGRVSLFDVRSDPAETRELSALRPELARAMLARLERRRAARPLEPRKVERRAQAERALEDLGYREVRTR